MRVFICVGGWVGGWVWVCICVFAGVCGCAGVVYLCVGVWVWVCVFCAWVHACMFLCACVYVWMRMCVHIFFLLTGVPDGATNSHRPGQGQKPVAQCRCSQWMSAAGKLICEFGLKSIY